MRVTTLVSPEVRETLSLASRPRKSSSMRTTKAEKAEVAEVAVEAPEAVPEVAVEVEVVPEVAPERVVPERAVLKPEVVSEET